MTTGDWSYGLDASIPSPARMYDYYLGGQHNFAADREAAERVIAIMPQVPRIAQANRAFLGNAVRYMLQHGVRQFLDVGSGLPTVGNVHELAAEVDPRSRVVYVDTDPVAIELSLALLRGQPNATAIRADLRYPDAILAHHNVRTAFDWTQPVGLLIVSVLQFVADDDAYPAVARLRDALAPGSYLAVSHIVADALGEDRFDAVAEVYRSSTAPTSARRDRNQVLRFFDGLDLVEPGLVWVSQWQPGSALTTDDHDIAIVAGVARKTA